MDLKKIAKEVSSLVNLVPAIAYGVLLWNDPHFLELLAASFLFFSFFPYYIVEEASKLPRNNVTKTRTVRNFLLSYAAGFAALWVFNAPPIVLAFSASLVAGHILAYFITPHWMMSTHSLLSVQTMTILALTGRLEAIPIFIIFLVFGWARIYLKAHTPMQYLAGGLVGFALTAAAFMAVGG